MADIHPTAIVDGAARIHPDATIGPYCVIGPDVEIGAGTVLHNHVVIQASTTLGAGNEVFPFAVIGSDPQDKKYHGEKATCILGDNNKIREHVTIHRGTTNGGGVTKLGDRNLIMVAAHVAHDSVLGDDIVIANQVMLAGHVHVEDGATIGGGAAVHHFATIGRSAFVGGLARITKDVPPYMIVEGNPAEVRKLNSLAMSRAGAEPEHIEAMKDAFKRLYRENGAAMSVKLEQLREDYADVDAVVYLCDRLEATAMGVHGRALENGRHDDKRAARPTVESGAGDPS